MRKATNPIPLSYQQISSVIPRYLSLSALDTRVGEPIAVSADRHFVEITSTADLE